MRRTLAQLHAWLGAASAVFVLLVSVSGCAILFSAPLLHLETGAFPRVDARQTGVAVDVESLISEARVTAGERFVPLGYLGPNSEIATSVEMIYGMSDSAEDGGEIQIVTFDPASGASLGSFLLDQTITHHLIEFHYEFLMGASGALFVAGLGLWLVALAVAGLYLWWPRGPRTWAGQLSLRLRGGAVTQAFSLHRFFGFWFALLTVVWALTGVYWSQPEWTPDAVMPATASIPAGAASSFETASCNDEVSAGEAVSLALAGHPGATLWEAEFAAPWQPYHTIYLSTGRDVDKKDGDVRVWVSASCPDTVADARVAGLGAVGAISASIHSGESFGALRVPIVLTVGMALSLLSITGLIVWIRRHWNPARRRRTA